MNFLFFFFLLYLHVLIHLSFRLSRNLPGRTHRTAPDDHSISKTPADIVERLICFLLFFPFIRILKQDKIKKKNLLQYVNANTKKPQSKKIQP